MERKIILGDFSTNSRVSKFYSPLSAKLLKLFMSFKVYLGNWPRMPQADLICACSPSLNNNLASTSF